MAIKVGEKDLFPYLGDYGPVSIYKGEQKIAGYKWAEKSGRELHFDNTYNSLVEVEVDGQSYQDGDPTPDYPIEIHSLNDFDVVSDVGGRNYFSVSFFGSVEGTSNPFYSGEIDYIYTLEPNTYYTLSTTAPPRGSSGSAYIHFGNFPLSASSNLNGIAHGSPKTILTNNEGRISITINRFGTQETISRIINGDYKIRLEKGTVATDWTPAPEDITPDSNHPLIDKINLSLSEPLRSVGDVKDRLFRDSDGLWKIERNVGEDVIDGSIDWYWHNSLSDDKKEVYEFSGYTVGAGIDKRVVTNQFSHTLNSSAEVNHIYMSEWPKFGVKKGYFEDTSNFSGRTISQAVKDHLNEKPLIINYKLNSPVIETLDQELQDKLNTLKSFKGSNYVYTVLPDDDLTPTIHAKTEVKDI